MTCSIKWALPWTQVVVPQAYIRDPPLRNTTMHYICVSRPLHVLIRVSFLLSSVQDGHAGAGHMAGDSRSAAVACCTADCRTRSSCPPTGARAHVPDPTVPSNMIIISLFFFSLINLLPFALLCIVSSYTYIYSLFHSLVQCVYSYLALSCI